MKYFITAHYADGTTALSWSNDIESVFSACAIYTADPSLLCLFVSDTDAPIDQYVVAYEAPA